MPTEKARLELRFDVDLFEKVKALADKATVSVNQLLQGLTRWAVKNGHVGEPVREESGILTARRQPGCLFFGRIGHVYSWEELEAYNSGDSEEVKKYDPGALYFTLDFTERHVVREEEQAKLVSDDGPQTQTRPATRNKARKKTSAVRRIKQ